jgi:2-polyprenyl-6-methoxyphenol hydroxylase-like FAD-dependent oxidoreductase
MTEVIARETHTDALIVGAGPVGLILACELRRRVVNCRLVDKAAKFPRTSRANGLQRRSMEVLDSLGLADGILERGYPVTGISLIRGGRELVRLMTRLDQPGQARPRPDQPYRAIALINQAVVEDVLRKKLADLDGHVELERELRGFEQTANHVIAELVDTASGSVERVTANCSVIVGSKPMGVHG